MIARILIVAISFTLIGCAAIIWLFVGLCGFGLSSQLWFAAHRKTNPMTGAVFYVGATGGLGVSFALIFHAISLTFALN